MKRMRNMGMWTLLVLLASCSANFRMITRIDKKGNIDREVYARGDSAFRAGDFSHNPFLFLPEGGWRLEYPDSSIRFNFFGEETMFNVKAMRTLKADFDSGDTVNVPSFSPKEEWMRPLAAPREKLEKRFRWFYTYYLYTCTFTELTEKGPVPLEKYIDQRDQALLFRGDLNTCEGMNGIELKNKLDAVADQFQQWFVETQFELSCEVWEETLKNSADTVYLPLLLKKKEEIWRTDKRLSENNDYSLAQVADLLDKWYKTNFFSNFYKRKEKEMNFSFDKKCRIIELFDNQIRFELAMPGKLLSANTTLVENDMPVWKVDAYRLLSGDYTLKAESRKTNVWAFCITGLFLLVAGYGWWKR